MVITSKGSDEPGRLDPTSARRARQVPVATHPSRRSPWSSARARGSARRSWLRLLALGTLSLRGGESFPRTPLTHAYLEPFVKAQIEHVHKPRHQKQTAAAGRKQIGGRLGVEAREVEAPSPVAHDDHELCPLQGQADFQVPFGAAVQYRVGASLFDGQHDLVDLFRVQRRQLEVGAKTRPHAEQR